MGSDFGINDLAPMGLQSCERADFIGTHKARVARNIGRENGCKSAFDPRLGHLMRADPAWDGKSTGQNRRASTEFAMSATGH
jgi:hypothetical protein